MELFASWSGLQMNCEKNQLFTVSLEPAESSAMMNSGFALGSLPIRYLGLPLMRRKLRVSKFSPLIEKLTKNSSLGPVSLCLMLGGCS